MIKLNESSTANVKVLGDDQLNQVVGGHRGGHRRRNYGHGYKGHGYNGSYNRESGYGSNYGCGYESKGYGEGRYDGDDASDDS